MCVEYSVFLVKGLVIVSLGYLLQYVLKKQLMSMADRIIIA